MIQYDQVNSNGSALLVTARSVAHHERTVTRMGIIQPPLFTFEKRCSGCQETLPTSDFHRNRAGTAGLSALCKTCMNAYRREHLRKKYAESAEYRDRCRFIYKLKKYGVTREQYGAMLLAQGGVCAICREVPTGKKGFMVDHDHTTGAVRGLLCSPCNSGIGGLRDKPALLRAAIEYLEHYDN